MSSENPLPRRPRGRPPRGGDGFADTRALLIRHGIELLTERGVSATGLDAVLRLAGVPKGSFYHYFSSKDDFVRAILEDYADYLLARLERTLGDPARSPLGGLQAFVDEACEGVARFDFRRGCLVGNLGQEVGCLEAPLREQLESIFCRWEARLADCLRAALAAGEIPAGSDCQALAHVFWVGWEGAILRARLMRSTAPMRAFFQLFLATLGHHRSVATMQSNPSAG